MFGFLNRENKAVGAVPVSGNETLTGCVGKLPMHAEFIKHNLKTREVVALDNWIQEGVTLLNRLHGESWKSIFASAPTHRFAFSGAGDEKSVYGVIKPSTDRSGRSYPFCLFGTSESAVFKEHQVLLPLAIEDFLKESETLLAQDWTGSHVAVLVEAIEKLGQGMPVPDRRSLIEIEMNRLRSVTLGQFWRELLPGTDSEQRARFVRTTVGILQTISRRSPQRIHWGVRLPLPGKADAMPYLTFWRILFCPSGRTSEGRWCGLRCAGRDDQGNPGYPSVARPDRPG